jgi:hypothetical protein
LISDPNHIAIGGKYEVREVTPGSPEGILVFSSYSEQDGSMRIDLSSLDKGTHTYKIVYIVWDIPSTPINCALTVTAVESKNVTKKISSYSLTKTWTLVVPRSSVSTVKMAN